MSEDALVLVGNDKGGSVSTLRVSDDALEVVATTEVGVGCSTFAVDVDLVYVAVKEPAPAVVTMRLDRTSGALTEVARRHVPDPLGYVAIVGGATLLAASYHGGWAASYPVVDGVIGDPATRVEYRNAHAAVADPTGHNAYIVSLGSDVIGQYSIGRDSELVELSEPVVRVTAGIGPRHLVVAPDGRNAYVVTEFTGEAIRFDRSEGGRLERREEVPVHDGTRGLRTSALGLDPKAGHLIWGADIALAADGRWLLCTERSESTVAAVELDGEGRLTDKVVFTDTEAQPRGLTVGPDGTTVIVVGEVSGHASLYRLADNGTMVLSDRVETGKGPNWVRFV